MKRTLRIIVAAALAALACSDANAADEKFTLSLATWGASSHPQVTQFAKKFMDTVEAKSNGRIKFKYFPDGVMVKEAFVPNAIPDGTVDIALTTIDNWAGRNKEVSITTTPLWTLSMTDTLHEIVPGKPIFGYFNRGLEKENTVILCLFDIGPAVISTNFPLHSPGDLKGKVMRSVSKGTAEILQGLGASPIVLSVGDVYSALQRGTVDGAMGGLQGAYGLKHYEVSKYMFATNGLMGTFIHGYVMNRKRFDALPPDLQKLIATTATDVRNETQEYLIKSYDDYLRKVEAQGVKVFEPKPGGAEWKQWEAALASFKEQSMKRYDPALVTLIAR